MSRYAVNDMLVYRTVIHRAADGAGCPVAGARRLPPAELGELYSYVTDEEWRVERVNPDQTIDAVAPDGTQRRFDSYDPCLSHASLRRRLVRRVRSFSAGLKTVR